MCSSFRTWTPRAASDAFWGCSQILWTDHGAKAKKKNEKKERKKERKGGEDSNFEGFAMRNFSNVN